MYAKDFEYDKKRLSEYGMIVCSFNGSSGAEPVSSGADIIYTQEKSIGSDIFHLHSAAYDSVYSSTFQICKDSCKLKNYQDMYLSPLEVSNLQRWLCRKSYQRFKIEQDNYRDIYWNAVFTSKQINVNGRIAGLELTMYTDAPYAYHDEIVHEFIFHNGDISGNGEAKKKYFHNISDVEGYLYPNLEIKIIQDGTLNLSLNDRVTKIANCKAQEVITIKGREQIISTSCKTHNAAKDFNFVFPRMERTYAQNSNCVSADLPCSITLTYSPVTIIGL